MKINTPFSWFICSLFKWKFKAIRNIRMTHSPNCTFNRANYALYFEVSSLIIAAQQTGEGQHDEGKVHPRTDHEGPEGEKRYSSIFSSTSVVDWGGWSTSRPRCFCPGKDPVPVGQEAGWAPGQVWTGAKRVIRVNSALHHDKPEVWSWDNCKLMKVYRVNWRVSSLIIGLLQTGEGQSGDLKSQQSDHGITANWWTSIGWTEESAVWSLDYCKLVKVNRVNWRVSSLSLDYCKLVKVNRVNWRVSSLIMG